MLRSKLPQDFVTEQGLVWEGFEPGHGWVFSGAEGSIETDTEHYIEGTQSIKLNAARTVQLKKTFSPYIDFRGKNRMIQVNFYLSEANLSSFDILYFTLFTSADWSKSFQSYVHSSQIQGAGWNSATIHRDDWTASGGATWDEPVIWALFKLQAPTGQTTSISLDNIRYNVHQRPMCVITFDDGAESAYSEGYVYMINKGIKGSFYIVPPWIGSSGFMTEANLAAMYDNGCAISNHTWDHPDLDTLTQTEIEQEIGDTLDWLNARGFTRSSRHLAYPYDRRNATVSAVMSNLGMLTGRIAGSGSFRAPLPDLYQIPQYMYLSSDLSLATAKERIDEAVKKDGTLVFVGHKLEAVAAMNTWAIADFQALIDYIIARKIACVTIDEWYEGLTNPRYRSLPLSRGGV